MALRSAAKGRGASFNTPTRFEALYREHGCIYCYARPSHEYLGFPAGIDFETKIMVKPDAPRLLAGTLHGPFQTDHAGTAGDVRLLKHA